MASRGHAVVAGRLHVQKVSYAGCVMNEMTSLWGFMSALAALKANPEVSRDGFASGDLATEDLRFADRHDGRPIKNPIYRRVRISERKGSAGR